MLDHALVQQHGPWPAPAGRAAPPAAARLYRVTGLAGQARRTATEIEHHRIPSAQPPANGSGPAARAAIGRTALSLLGNLSPDCRLAAEHGRSLRMTLVPR